MTREQSVRHESAHVVAARLLGWHVRRVYVFPGGGGQTMIYSPEGLDRRTRARELALIALAARAYAGWTCSDGDRLDRIDAHNAISELTNDWSRRSELADELRRDAQRMVELSEFRVRASRVARALDAYGELDSLDLRDLFRNDSFRWRPEPELRHLALPR